MPITLPPIPPVPQRGSRGVPRRIPRRRFLGGSLAACAPLLLGPRQWTRWALGADNHSGDQKTDPHRFALLSDVHIAADPAAHERGVVMADHLKQAVEQVLRLDPRPNWVSVDGDCAYHLGLEKDYATLVGLLRPLREAGLPIHLTLGNHDNRDHFHAAFATGEGKNVVPEVTEAKSPVEDRVALRLESQRATWFVLDSLDKTNSTPGVVGEKQLAWLAGALDAESGSSAKPALVMVHHNPEDPPKQKPSGLTDTKALFDVVLPRKRVKALFYGHTHTWRLAERDGLHLVNFPAVAYPFKPEEPTGWVDGRLEADGMSLELRCVEPNHPRNGDKHRLTWRT